MRLVALEKSTSLHPVYNNVFVSIKTANTLIRNCCESYNSNVIIQINIQAGLNYFVKLFSRISHHKQTGNYVYFQPHNDAPYRFHLSPSIVMIKIQQRRKSKRTNLWQSEVIHFALSIQHIQVCLVLICPYMHPVVSAFFSAPSQCLQVQGAALFVC